MQNISVYLNQKASNGSLLWQEQINNALFRSTINYPNCKNIEELHQNLEKDVANKVDAILSVGGDGTVHSIIQKLAGTDVSLLVVPGGTANDLAMEIGSSRNIKQISQSIRQNIKKKIDLVCINGRFMATNGGIGFASEVANEINLMRTSIPQFKNIMRFSGKNIYKLFLGKKLLSKEISSYRLKLNSAEYQGEVCASLVLINNQPVLGGSFEVAPETSNQDGKFNVTILKHRSRLELVSCLLKILSMNHPKDDEDYITFETSEIDIELLEGADISFFGDGENFPAAKHWNIKCYSQFLSLYSPKDQINFANCDGQFVSLH